MCQKTDRGQSEDISPSRCPFCGYEVTGGVWEEIAHMEAEHPRVIEDRLEAAGFRLRDGRWVDLLAGGSQEEAA